MSIILGGYEGHHNFFTHRCTQVEATAVVASCIILICYVADHIPILLSNLWELLAAPAPYHRDEFVHVEPLESPAQFMLMSFFVTVPPLFAIIWMALPYISHPKYCCRVS